MSVSVDDLKISNDTLGGSVIDLSDLIFDCDAPMKTAAWDFNSQTLDPAFHSFELSDDIALAVGNLSLDGDADGNPGIGYIEDVYVAILGDLNLDGDVDVSQIVFGPGGLQNAGNASILLANLGTIVVPPAAVFAASSHARRAVSASPAPLATESVVALSSIPVLSANTVSTSPLGAWESAWHQSARKRLALANVSLTLSGSTPEIHQAVDDFFAASEEADEGLDWQDLLWGSEI